MTECHHLINSKAQGLFSTLQIGETSMEKSVKSIFHFFEAVNNAIEVQFFFQDFISTLYHRHW